MHSFHEPVFVFASQDYSTRVVYRSVTKGAATTENVPVLTYTSGDISIDYLRSDVQVLYRALLGLMITIRLPEGTPTEPASFTLIIPTRYHEPSALAGKSLTRVNALGVAAYIRKGETTYEAMTLTGTLTQPELSVARQLDALTQDLRCLMNQPWFSPRQQATIRPALRAIPQLLQTPGTEPQSDGDFFVDLGRLLRSAVETLPSEDQRAARYLLRLDYATRQHPERDLQGLAAACYLGRTNSRRDPTETARPPMTRRAFMRQGRKYDRMLRQVSITLQRTGIAAKSIG